MKRIILVILAAAVAAGCGGGDAAGPSPTDITGTWRATKAEFVSRSPAGTTDLIASGGSATLVLGPGGDFTLTLNPAGRPSEVTRGTWKLDGDVMTVTPAGMRFSWQFDVAFSGDRLRLSDADVEFDVNGDTLREQAKLNLELTR